MKKKYKIILKNERLFFCLFVFPTRMVLTVCRKQVSLNITEREHEREKCALRVFPDRQRREMGSIHQITVNLTTCFS